MRLAGTATGRLHTVGPPAANGQVATCWIVRVADRFYVTNTGSNTITGYREATDGTLSLLDPDGVTAVTDAGPIDLGATVDGRYLYELNGNAGTAGIFAIAGNGSLTRIGTLTGLPPFTGTASGMEGIIVI
jgi:hypothetical protein